MSIITTHSELAAARPARRVAGQTPVGVYWAIALLTSLALWAGIFGVIDWAF